MNNKLLIAGLVVLAIAGGLVGGYAAYQLTPSLGGAFAGGVTPTNYFTGSASGGGSNNGYVQPVGNLELSAPNGFGYGTAAAQEITALYTATEAYPSTAVTLGPITASNAATSTSLSFSAAGFSVGDACEITYNGVSGTPAFGADAFVTAVSGSAVTTTATLWNGATASTTLTVTSTATGASSTLKATCFHTGV